jgi:exoribonuclease R
MPAPEQILTFFKERVVHPTTARELARLLRVPRDERVAFKRDLTRLVMSGQLVHVRGNRFALPDTEHLVAGRLQTNPGGFGFVAPDDASAGLAPTLRQVQGRPEQGRGASADEAARLRALEQRLVGGAGGRGGRGGGGGQGARPPVRQRLNGLITAFVGSGARTGTLSAPTTTMRDTLAEAKADLAAIERELK